MKLSIRLALVITVLALLASSLLALASFLSIQERITLSAQQSIASLTKTVYSMAATAAYVGDTGLAQEVVAGLQYNEEISCVKIFAPTLSDIANEGCSGELALVRELQSPWFKDEVVGTLVIYQNDAYLEALSRDQAMSELRNLISVVLIVSASIMLLAYFMLTKPLDSIASQIHSISFDREVKLLKEGDRSDEIGEICRLTNRLLANAKKQIFSTQIMASKTEELGHRFKLIFELSESYLAVTDEHLALQSWNPKFDTLVKQNNELGPQMDSDDWLASVSDDPDRLKKQILDTATLDCPKTVDVEVGRTQDDEASTHYYTLTYAKSASSVQGVTIFIFINNITNHRKALIQKEYQASHDTLTGILNRAAAIQKATSIMTSLAEEEQMAIIFVDLDGFKQVNDDFGHDVGDQVLKIVAQRILSVTRDSDIVSRWGGDEFLIALPHVSYTQAQGVAQKVLQSILQPLDIPLIGSIHAVGASIGVALSGSNTQTFDALCDEADQAMYHVKRSGKNGVKVVA